MHLAVGAAAATVLAAASLPAASGGLLALLQCDGAAGRPLRGGRLADWLACRLLG